MDTTLKRFKGTPAKRYEGINGDMSSNSNIEHKGTLHAAQNGRPITKGAKDIFQGTPTCIEDTQETVGGKASNENKVKQWNVVQASSMNSILSNNIEQDNKIKVNKKFNNVQDHVNHTEDCSSTGIILAAAMDGKQNNVIQDNRQTHRTDYNCSGPVTVDNDQTHNVKGIIVTPLMNAEAAEIEQRMGITSTTNVNGISDEEGAVSNKQHTSNSLTLINPMMNKDTAVGMTGICWDEKVMGAAF